MHDDYNHEHEPDCTCGCHEHEHAHEHEHEHGTHDVLESACATIHLESHTHEETATVSMDIEPHVDSALSFSDIVTLMQAVASAVESAGGIVGHIKAFARRDDAFVHASVTASYLDPECEGDTEICLDTATELQLAVIALLIEREQLLALCKNALLANL